MAKQQQNQVTRPLAENLGGLQPNVVGFTIEASDIEKMAMEYLTTEGIRPAKSLVITKDTGRGELVLRQYLFFERNDSAIRGGGNKPNQPQNNQRQLNPAVARKMPTGGVGISKELQRLLQPIALPDGKTRAIPAKHNLVVIEIDPVAVTGLLLDAELGIHRIIITNVQKTRNSTLIDVYKRLEENDFDPGSNVDRFTAALRNIR